MELLLATSLTVPDLLTGRLLALRRMFLGPVGAVLLVDAAFLMAPQGASGNSGDGWVSTWLARMALLALDAVALSWTGMWIGMSARGSRTTGGVFSRVILLPWLIVFGIVTLAVATNLSTGGNLLPEPSYNTLVLLWFLLGAANDVHWILRSRNILQQQFRDLATTRPGEKKSGAWPWNWFRTQG